MKKKSIIILSIVAVIVIAAFLVYSKAVAPKPDDNASAKFLTFENLKGTQYTEVLLIWGNGITKNLTAGVYNTIGLNSPDSTGNTSPDEVIHKLDLEKIQKDNKTLKVILNGPRLWTVDKVEVNAGKIRDFGGLEARWVMWFPIPKDFKQGSFAYKPMEVIRDTRMHINTGSFAFLMDGPDGYTYVMKSADRIYHPEQKYSDLKDLGAKLQLPAGWKFRCVTLEKDLAFYPDKGKGWIVQDDIGNTYDRIGGNYSNYIP
jgi:hypothetical protein